MQKMPRTKFYRMHIRKTAIGFQLVCKFANLCRNGVPLGVKIYAPKQHAKCSPEPIFALTIAASSSNEGHNKTEHNEHTNY